MTFHHKVGNVHLGPGHGRRDLGQLQVPELSAGAAQEVVVRFGACIVEILAAAKPEHPKLSLVHEHMKIAVYGRRREPRMLATQGGVNLLGGEVLAT